MRKYHWIESCTLIYNWLSEVHSLNIKNLIKTGIPDSILIHKLKKQGSCSVLFTFDDGPSPEFTPVVLKILKEHQVRAIFFIEGQLATSYPGLVRRISEAGHILGNHSYSHSHETRMSSQEFKADILKCQETIVGITGEEPSFFRPPGGAVSIASLAVAAFNRLTTMLWTIEGYEWTQCRECDPNLIGRQMVSRIKGGDIVLMHDNNPKVPSILNLMLPKLKNREYDLAHGIQHT